MQKATARASNQSYMTIIRAQISAFDLRTKIILNIYFHTKPMCP